MIGYIIVFICGAVAGAAAMVLEERRK